MSAVMAVAGHGTPALQTGLHAQLAAARRSGLRAREAAHSLGLSEGAALAAHAGVVEGALQVTALHGPWVELLQGLEACGPVMALTRNDAAVHEKTGVYRNVSAEGPVGLALDADIDLRLFFRSWHAGYAVQEAAAQPGQAPQHSLQFFNAQGLAVHKVFARIATDLTAWNALVARFADPQATPAVFAVAPPPKPLRSDSEIDVAALAADWAAMQDTHEFFTLLQRHGVERQQSFRLVEGSFAQRVPCTAVWRLLAEAAVDGTPIMVFVGSGGCIQIHSGPVQRVEPMVRGDVRWLNVLDPGFNLHLREDLIDSVWVVEKPTVDGIVTSVEVFDAQSELIAMFFGVRKPGSPELPAWRDLVGRLPR